MFCIEILNAVKVDFLYAEEPNSIITIFYISWRMKLFQVHLELDEAVLRLQEVCIKECFSTAGTVTILAQNILMETPGKTVDRPE
jgi:hypothetical protein